ncbi:hypothetical protein AURDEDRAFT_175774 [Auricularia subglabra TFB-10046 SS5]|uniref:GST N-terminal domain-containing protein n=1 Tax=Auricularia subglabra (strain TFB-10046 / SS5) TaxID=717982 RepID=J0LE88_AURST|nr:hypothetical protein AURDEDRAFT_175774 [Auricularia subglabra TFB-10046 SS5]
MVLPNGLEHYTAPTIEDDANVLPDSSAISDYLDKKYPDAATALFPPGTRALQLHFAQFLDGTCLVFAFAPLILPRIKRCMDAPGVVALDKIYQGSQDVSVLLSCEKPLYVDFTVAATFVPIKFVIPKDGWDRVSVLHGGKWAKLLDVLDTYVKA